ncbi:MAG: hypothetical protein ABSC56_12990 [Solirubrobacteraceae bacterium]
MSASAVGQTRARLHRYAATDGQARELILIDAAQGSRLLVDGATDGTDQRLLAHLSGDEPDANAEAVCRDYLAATSRRCRRLRPADLRMLGEGAVSLGTQSVPPPAVLVDANGARYRLAVAGTPAELRWQRDLGGRVSVVSARDVVAALQDYEPVRALSHAAICALRYDRHVSIAALGLELRRLEASPIVLNRRLREAVLRAVRERGVSLSAIAIACGRMKRDPRGNGSGETSWLARRVGLVADGPAGSCNPWVHSDTLALIARDGLGIAPREVELG